MLCLIAIWTVIPVFSKCKIYRWWKKFNILSFAFSLLLIIKMTLWDRSVGFREVELRPFYTLTTISYNNEALRTLLMNVILFLPFGLTIPYVAEVIKIMKNKFRWILCMVSGFLLSVAIESFQYYFCLGRAETDDVICNTLGCVLGVMANVISYRKRKQFTKV